MSGAILVGILISVAPGPQSSIGVLRVARGGFGVEGLARVAPGEALPENATVHTGERGFVELSLGDDVRLRLFAATRLLVARDARDDGWALSLSSGRIWVQCGRSTVMIDSPLGRASLQTRSSAVIEHTRSLGLVVAVRAGEAALEVSGRAFPIRARQIATRTPLATLPSTARPSGSGLQDLLSLETERALGDWIGLRAFLLERTAVLALGDRDARGGLRTDAELSGSDAGPAGALLESALRPPPFFDREVPPKGPNVRVEVTFQNE